jgi:GDP-L-fucose synthase
MSYKNVLVTGGSGFLGKRLKKFKPQWTYVSSKDYDLTSYKETDEMIKEHQPDAIIHLAAKVGGVKENQEKQGEFFYKNVYINTNVVEAARNNGVKRLLASLSTCAFPDTLERYPFIEEDLFSGKPAESNLSYGYTKRLLHVQCLSYRKQYGLNYSTFCPSNIYGPEDHFNQESSHFVASLVSKIVASKNGDTLEFWGTGAPLRQQLYVDDLCRIIPELLEKHNTNIPLIIAPEENLSIKEMCEIALNISKKDVKYTFNGYLDGQYRKDGSNLEFKKLVGNINFTSFEEGVLNTFKYVLGENK